MTIHPLSNVARVIRSKNSSPFTLTLDIVFRSKRDYDAAKASTFLTREIVADLYSCPIDDVGEIIYYAPALAVKVSVKRLVPSGSFGDSDVYGAQQHAPLLDQLQAPQD